MRRPERAAFRPPSFGLSLPAGVTAARGRPLRGAVRGGIPAAGSSPPPRSSLLGTRPASHHAEGRSVGRTELALGSVCAWTPSTDVYWADSEPGTGLGPRAEREHGAQPWPQGGRECPSEACVVDRQRLNLDFRSPREPGAVPGAELPAASAADRAPSPPLTSRSPWGSGGHGSCQPPRSPAGGRQ